MITLRAVDQTVLGSSKCPYGVRVIFVLYYQCQPNAVPSPAVFIKIIFRHLSVMPTAEEKLFQGTVSIIGFLLVQDRNVTPTSPIFVIRMCLSNVSVRRDFPHDVFKLLPTTLRRKLHWSIPSFKGGLQQFLTPWIQRKYSTSSALKEVDFVLLRLAIPFRN